MLANDCVDWIFELFIRPLIKGRLIRIISNVAPKIGRNGLKFSLNRLLFATNRRDIPIVVAIQTLLLSVAIKIRVDSKKVAPKKTLSHLFVEGKRPSE